MNAFERDKRARNLKEGCHEDKGLKDGRCNRRACQAPLKPETEALGRRYSMSDHESFTDARLYYCGACAVQFDRSDDQFREPRRITVEVVPEMEAAPSAE